MYAIRSYYEPQRTPMARAPAARAMAMSYSVSPTTTARFAAVYGIVGVLAVPLNYFAIDLFGGAAMHPDNLKRGSLGAGMGLPFVTGIATALLAFV